MRKEGVFFNSDYLLFFVSSYVKKESEKMNRVDGKVIRQLCEGAAREGRK